MTYEIVETTKNDKPKYFWRATPVPESLSDACSSRSADFSTVDDCRSDLLMHLATMGRVVESYQYGDKE